MRVLVVGVSCRLWWGGLVADSGRRFELPVTFQLLFFLVQMSWRSLLTVQYSGQPLGIKVSKSRIS